MTDLAAIVARLGLVPHPEGGFFRETFRDDLGHGGRGHSTAIYYLIGGGHRSAWHRIDAVETWHFYAGAPAEMRLSADGRRAEAIRLGPDILGGEVPQVIVPRHVWQTAASLGAWTLAGCTVAPAFDFAGFELAPADFEPA